MDYVKPYIEQAFEKRGEMKMKNENENITIDQNDKNIKKMLNKLISDEWFAGNIYKQFAILVKPEQRDAIFQPMIDVANDELNDHYKNLVEFALQNGYSIPTTYNEMKKFADKDDIKLFENCKKGEDAIQYVEQGIKAEDRAIKIYEEYVDQDWLNKDPELQMIVRNNYYDEVDHLNKFKFMLDSFEAMNKFM